MVNSVFRARGSCPELNMADGVDIDLYADVESEFQHDDFATENNDLYDDVLTAGSKDATKKDALTPQKDDTTPSPARINASGSSGSAGIGDWLWCWWLRNWFQVARPFTKKIMHKHFQSNAQLMLIKNHNRPVTNRCIVVCRKYSPSQQ